MAFRSHGQSSVTSVALNFINVIVSGGVLGFPYTAKVSGYVTAIALSILIVLLAESTLNLLVRTASSDFTPSHFVKYF